jgi:SAM-dependent methyltransferase
MLRCVRCDASFDGTWRTCARCGFAPIARPSYLSFVADTNAAGFEGQFFEALADLEPGFWWFEARNELIVWALRQWFPRMTSFLEVGCGTGFVVARLTQEFPNVRVAASEPFAEAMPFVARRAPRAAVYQFDACEIPFRDEFDVIGAFDVVEHIEADDLALAEMRRALRAGGGLVLTVPQHPFLWGPSDDFAHHERRYTRTLMRARLEAAGYRVVAFRSFVALLMPLLIASRLAARRSADPDPGAEFRIPALLNRCLRAVMGLERAAIRAGVDSPIGGSLLVVAQRAD